MREWRNRQTRTFEGRVGQLVRVQVPSLAPDQIERSGFFVLSKLNTIISTNTNTAENNFSAVLFLHYITAWQKKFKPCSPVRS